MYYILAERITGALIQASTEPLAAGTDEILKQRQGDIPDLTKFEWHGGSLAFVPKASRTITRLAFTRRLTNDELAAIYGAAKSSILLEVWLDKFKLAEEINLDDPEIVQGLYGVEQMGLLAAGRAAEVLS